MTSSILALLAVLAAAALVVSLLMRVRSRSVRWLAVAAFWCAAIAGILIVDVNVPLSESHLYPDSQPAPLWLALSATFARFGALASIFLARGVGNRSLSETRND